MQGKPLAAVLATTPQLTFRFTYSLTTTTAILSMLLFPTTLPYSICGNRPTNTAPPRQCSLCTIPTEEIEKFVIRSDDLDNEFADLTLTEVFKLLNWPDNGAGPSTTSSTPLTKKRSNVTELLEREKRRRLSKKGGTSKPASVGPPPPKSPPDDDAEETDPSPQLE